MNKYFHDLLIGVSVLPALAVVPAMADELYYTWAHPDIDSYSVINGDVNYTVPEGTYNIITGTAMRNYVNGNVNLIVDGVTQQSKANPHTPNDGGQETSVYGFVFVPSTTSQYLATTELGVETPTDAEQKAIQEYITGNLNVLVRNSNIDNNVIGVNFYASGTELTNSGVVGKTTITVENSEVGLGVRGTNYRDYATAKAGAFAGDIEMNIKDSLVKEEIVTAGSASSAGNVVINIKGDSVIGYTTRDANVKSHENKDNWIIAGANRKGATVESTVVNLDTAGAIKIAGDVHTGSRDRNGASNDPEVGSVIGDATLNMLGGGTIDVGGDLRAYHVGGKTALNINNVTANVAGTIKEFQTINMDENAKLTVGNLEMTANDTLNVTLANTDAYSKIVVDTLDANHAVLNMVVRNAGTYDVIEATTLTSDFDWNLDNALYKLTHEDDTGTVVAALRTVDDMVSYNNIEQDTAKAFAAASQSSSAKLKDFSEKVQAGLASGDAGAKAEIEHATKALNPETKSVAQSVSTSIQSAVANLAGARMSVPMAGRNGGDVNLTGGGVWVQGLYNKAKQNDAFNGYTRGLAVGLDGTINNDWMVGMGYAYATSDVNGSARDTDVESNTVFVYGQYKPSDWYVNAVLNYTMSDYTEKGMALGTPVSADYGLDSFGGRIATGYDFAGGITPELGLRYMHVNGETYTNSMDVMNRIDSADYLTATLGTKYGFNMMFDKLLVRPELRYAVIYDMISDDNMTFVTMPGTAAYTLTGERLSRIGGEFGIGLGMKYKSADVSLNYDIEVREDYTSQTGRLKFRYEF